jgi:hypothetical protein
MDLNNLLAQMGGGAGMDRAGPAQEVP